MSVLFCAELNAQVTIGSGQPPTKAALLDIKDQDADADNITSTSGGLLMPRVKLVDLYTLEPFIDIRSEDWTDLSRKTREKHIGLLVYNLRVDPQKDGFKQGIYEWDGEKWCRLRTNATPILDFFYMPSFNLPVTSIDADLEFDLYAEYERQFKKTGGNANFVSSNPLLTEVSDMYSRTELDYVVTDFDSSIITISGISSTGVISYKVHTSDIPAESYINIIFVVKQQ